jgi:hypothetical protein
LALVALGAAAFFTFQSEKQIEKARAAVRGFDVRAREVAEALADLRAAQQAYVAEGQGASFWMSKVDAIVNAVAGNLETLAPLAASGASHESLAEAVGTVNEFRAVDKRAREYLRAGQSLMAGDVIFTEGGQTAVAAARQIEAARVAEHETLDAAEVAARIREATVLGGAIGIVTMIVLLLVPRPRAVGELVQQEAAPSEASSQPTSPPAYQLTAGPAPDVLRTAAELCTGFGRVRDMSDLQLMLGRAANAMSASGVIVWRGEPPAGDLKPLVAHGYPPQALARMASVPRSADNAAAAAYRSGELRIVLSRPGSTSGAIVAPIFSSDGCVGALSAEIRGGGEASDAMQALAAIIAAQVSTMMPSASDTDSMADEGRAAAS